MVTLGKHNRFNMSLNRFTNIDDITGYVPVFGETIPSSSKDALSKTILKITENDLRGVYDEGDVDTVSELHIYAGENRIQSYYSNPLDYIGSKLYIQPEKDIRDAELIKVHILWFIISYKGLMVLLKIQM